LFKPSVISIDARFSNFTEGVSVLCHVIFHDHFPYKYPIWQGSDIAAFTMPRRPAVVKPTFSSINQQGAAKISTPIVKPLVVRAGMGRGHPAAVNTALAVAMPTPGARAAKSETDCLERHKKYLAHKAIHGEVKSTLPADCDFSWSREEAKECAKKGWEYVRFIGPQEDPKETGRQNPRRLLDLSLLV
jgi:hypothetical protein